MLPRPHMPVYARLKRWTARFFAMDDGAYRHASTPQKDNAPPRILDDPLLSSLVERHIDRVEALVKCPNVMPSRNVAMKALDAALDAEDQPDDIPPRPQDMRRRSRLLRAALKGQPKYVWVHALCVAYLEMNTPHADHARTLFLRLWEERGVALSSSLPTEDLIRALYIFARHGETTGQRSIGAAGAVYGAMIRITESERALADVPLQQGPSRMTAQISDIGMAGMTAFALDGCRDPLKMHDLLLDVSLSDGHAGLALQALCLRSRAGENVFSRLDRARLDILGPEAFERSDHWAFGMPPDGEQPG